MGFAISGILYLICSKIRDEQNYTLCLMGTEDLCVWVTAICMTNQVLWIPHLVTENFWGWKGRKN